MGIVYVPMPNELYLGVRGYGAFCTFQRTIHDNIAPFHCCLVMDDQTMPFVKRWEWWNAYYNMDVMPRGAWGWSARHLLYRNRRLDVVYAANEGWKPWDFCEASVIAVKADASIEALLLGNEGEQLDLYAKSVICAGNQELLDECRR